MQTNRQSRTGNRWGIRNWQGLPKRQGIGNQAFRQDREFTKHRRQSDTDRVNGDQVKYKRSDEEGEDRSKPQLVNSTQIRVLEELVGHV